MWCNEARHASAVNRAPTSEFSAKAEPDPFYLGFKNEIHTEPLKQSNS